MTQWMLSLKYGDQEFDLWTLGNVLITQEHRYVFHGFMRKWFNEYQSQLPGTGAELVMVDMFQGLLNPEVTKFHDYRIAWGGSDPDEHSSVYPVEGHDMVCTLYRLVNCNYVSMLKVVLPKKWWELDEDERERILRFNLD